MPGAAPKGGGLRGKDWKNRTPFSSPLGELSAVRLTERAVPRRGLSPWIYLSSSKNATTR